ncbi:MAG: hypothetical protein H0U07_14345 [Actinobacteria bacterium]|nr:hypothetical protein [Actinomycetota bacterium]
MRPLAASLLFVMVLAGCGDDEPEFRPFDSADPGSVRDGPPFLGLIESRDAGEHWRAISLRGDVDFHVLAAQDTSVYGFGSDFETREPRFLSSEDRGRSWKRLSPPAELTGLTIDPRDSRHIVALGEQRGYVSRDGGSRWRPLAVPAGWSPGHPS